MPEQFKSWKLSVERLCAASVVDWHEAARLVAEIATRSTDETLRQAAAQAIPILRNVALDGVAHATTEAARRRLMILLVVLHEMTAPRFGRRDAAPKPPNAEERARKALGLPLGRPLVCAEIHQAFRRAAKSMHPDAGGSEDAFLELIAAQDVLLHPGNHKGE